MELLYLYTHTSTRTESAACGRNTNQRQNSKIRWRLGHTAAVKSTINTIPCGTNIFQKLIIVIGARRRKKWRAFHFSLLFFFQYILNISREAKWEQGARRSKCFSRERERHQRNRTKGETDRRTDSGIIRGVFRHQS